MQKKKAKNKSKQTKTKNNSDICCWNACQK